MSWRRVRTLVNPHAELPMVASGGYLHSMRTVDLRVLNSKLREYIRLAASGETVLVTDRGRAVAEIVPPRQESSPLPGRGTPCRRGAPRAVDAACPGERGTASDASYDVRSAHGGTGRRPRGPVIDLDAPVAPARLLSEDRRPPNGRYGPHYDMPARSGILRALSRHTDDEM